MIVVTLPVLLVMLAYFSFTIYQNNIFYDTGLYQQSDALVYDFHYEVRNNIPQKAENYNELAHLLIKVRGATFFPERVDSNTNFLSYYYVDKNGEEIFSYGDVVLDKAQIRAAITDIDRYKIVCTSDLDYALIILPFSVDDSDSGYSIVVYSTIAYEKQHKKLYTAIFQALIITALVCFIFVYLVGNKIAKPIVSLANHIVDPDKHVLEDDTNNKGEISILTQAFLSMQKEIAHKMEELNKEVAVRSDAEERAQKIAFYDQLTGLPNRYSFNRHLDTIISEDKAKNEFFALLFIDLDGFKVVNDLYGHSIGDHLLKILADRLKVGVGERNYIARFGGDEFVAISQLEDIYELAQDIVAICSQPVTIDGYELMVSSSVGISFYPQHGKTRTELLKHADIAMYKAKQKGGSHSVLFEISMSQKIVEENKIKEDLLLAIERDEFELHYQPILDLKDGRVTCLEALVRWRHPERGLLYPDSFIEIAEQADLISDIGNIIIRKACRQYQYLKNAIQDNLLETICINVSPKQLEIDGLEETVKSVILETGIGANEIEIELTENILLDNNKIYSKKLKRIRELGVQVAIDDFGTGYSSFSYLWQFPIDTLKIDRSFVDGCAKDKSKQGILQAIVAITKALSIYSIAEGIETKADADVVLNSGCGYGQGYYYSKPLTVEQLEDYLKNNKSLAS